MTIRFVDLFSGVGGIRKGFEQALNDLKINYACVLSSEIDNKTRETYFLNFGENPLGDIREIDNFPQIDFLLAGFPCQPFSYAGKHKGFGDTRGTLFFEIERILKNNRPTGFLLENVRGLKSHDKGNTFRTILNALHNLGYKTNYIICNSSEYGVPQNRVRLFIFGLYDKTPILNAISNLGPPDSHSFKTRNKQEDFFSISKNKQGLVKDILEARPDRKHYCSDDFISKLKNFTNNNLESLHGKRLIDFRGGNSIHSWELGLKGECSEDEIIFMNQLIGNRRKKVFGTHQDGKSLTISQIKTFYYSNNINEIIRSLLSKGYLSNKNNRYNPVCGNMSFEVFKFLDPEGISITLTTADSHRLGVVQNGIPRRITPRECARLQGFPDSFILHPKDDYAYKQIGNSVSIPVVKSLCTDFLENNYSYIEKTTNGIEKKRKKQTG